MVFPQHQQSILYQVGYEAVGEDADNYRRDLLALCCN